MESDKSECQFFKRTILAVIWRRNWSKRDELMTIAVVQTKKSWLALVGWGDKEKWGEKKSRRYSGEGYIKDRH